MEGLLAII